MDFLLLCPYVSVYNRILHVMNALIIIIILCVFAGLVSQSFDLSDQPNFGTWYIRVDAFVSITILTLLLQAQFMQNFFKNMHFFLYLVCWSLVFQFYSGIQRFHYVHICMKDL